MHHFWNIHLNAYITLSWTYWIGLIESHQECHANFCQEKLNEDQDELDVRTQWVLKKFKTKTCIGAQMVAKITAAFNYDTCDNHNN